MPTRRTESIISTIPKEERLERYSVFNTLTDSDFVNFRQESARKRSAKQRMALSLGNKIAKAMEIDEVVENGVLVGYRIDVEVRKAEGHYPGRTHQ